MTQPKRNTGVVFVSAFALLAFACGEDDPVKLPPPMDAGGTPIDAGTRDAGVRDAGTRDGGPTARVPVVEAPMSGQRYTLEQARENETMETVRWTAAMFSEPNPARYRVEVDVAAGGFGQPMALGETDALELPVTVESVNEMLRNRGLPPAVAAALELRVVATAGASQLVSETVPFEVTPYMTVTPTIAPMLSSPAPNTTITLDRTMRATALPAFTWSLADFGTGAEVRYEVQLDREAGDFTAPIWVGETAATALELAVTHGHMNERIVLADLPLTAMANVKIRVVATSTDGRERLPSPPVVVSVVPFTYREIGVPGSYQGWDPANSNTTIFAIDDDDNVEGYIYFDASGGEFKYVEGFSWDTNWGTDGAGTLVPNSNNLVWTGAGVLARLRLDLNAMTHEEAAISAWVLTGTATTVDIALPYDQARRVFRATGTMNPGTFVFRATDGLSAVVEELGDPEGDGKLERSAGGIRVREAGTYTVELRLRGPLYRYSLEKN